MDLYFIDGQAWWHDNKDMLIAVLAHEAGHAVYKVDSRVSYTFNKLLKARTERTELQKYVEEYYEESKWDGEMFAYKFEGWVAGVDEWCGTKITTELIKRVEDVKNWINE